MIPIIVAVVIVPIIVIGVAVTNPEVTFGAFSKALALESEAFAFALAFSFGTERASKAGRLSSKVAAEGSTSLLEVGHDAPSRVVGLGLPLPHVVNLGR